MGDLMRDVLSAEYRSMYDKAAAKHRESGLCPSCARKLAVSEVLAVACRAADARDRMNIQLAEHGVVIVDNNGDMPCFR